MDQVQKIVPSYWTRRRQVKKETENFFNEYDSTCNDCENVELINDAADFSVKQIPSNENDSDIRGFTYNSLWIIENDDDYDVDIFNCADDNMIVLDSDDSCDEAEYVDCAGTEEGCSDASDTNSNLHVKLADWATNYCVPFVIINALLLILREFHPELPVDARTLMSTPRQTNLKQLKSGGEYIHFGIRRGLEQMLNFGFFGGSSHLKLQFNVDGLPLFKSSGKTIWPILCSVVNATCKLPFIVGIFCGMSKPCDLMEYLADYIADVNELVCNGFLHQHARFTVALDSFVCDAPARAMMKNVKSHSGYFGCDKCKQEGEWHGKVTFQETTAELRTDAQFDEMFDEEHHLGKSPVTSVPIGMVTGFPLDYMHLVCLGVMRRLLLWWLKGPITGRLPSSSISKLSDKLVRMTPYIPREFARKPRPVTEIFRWKATEFRQFLLYTGPVALFNLLPNAQYQNFLLLFVGISLLVNPKFCEVYCDYAKDLLVTCVENMKIVYGKDMLVYNVHGLVHLADDVRNFGSLDNFSAFKYENMLKSIKKLIRRPSLILQQVARRMSEKEINLITPCNSSATQSILKNEHATGPLPTNFSSFKQYGRLILKSYSVSLNTGDNCIAVQNAKPCLVRNILSNGLDVYLVVESFCHVTNFFESPLPSESLGIYQVSQHNGSYEVVHVDNMLHKCLLLPLNSNCFVVIPQMHTE